MYIPAAWVTFNAKILSEANPTGNGEYDYAFLAVTGSANGTALPAAFQHLSLSGPDAYEGEPIVAGTYAAQFLSSSEIQSALYPTIVSGAVESIYTFMRTTIDVVTVNGSVAAQEGSSGGGIARADSSLLGIVVTSTTEGQTSARTLAAITTSYIARSYLMQTGKDINDLLQNDPKLTASDFAPHGVELRKILVENLHQ
jgi:hypothetical protein